MKSATNPTKSFRPNADDAALMQELMEFYGVSSEGELMRMAYRALNRERKALEDLYVRPAKTSQSDKKSGK